MKGDVVIYLLAFIFMILFVSIIVLPVSGKYPFQKNTETATKEIKVCKTDEDCISDIKGERCLLIYPGDFVPFCGCLTSEDCGVGSCDSSNKCS